MSKNLKSDNTSIIFLVLFGVALIVLKITKVIDLGWWQVTIPFWLPPIVIILIISARKISEIEMEIIEWAKSLFK